ncbi:hypothetical protein D3C86_1513810 [compost metagenome]
MQARRQQGVIGEGPTRREEQEGPHDDRQHPAPLGRVEARGHEGHQLVEDHRQGQVQPREEGDLEARHEVLGRRGEDEVHVARGHREPGHQGPGVDEGEPEARREGGERFDDAPAQLLEVLDEGHLAGAALARRKLLVLGGGQGGPREKSNGAGACAGPVVEMD